MEMDYVFRDKDLTLIIQHDQGTGTITLETLYRAFKQRMILEGYEEKEARLNGREKD